MAEQMEKLAPPRHIAIIMDGNGRWAKKRGLPRTAGHRAGGETFRRIANYCRTLGVKYLTVYAFSTENWKRSEEEISALMTLLAKYLEEGLRDMEKNHVCFRFFGDLTRLNPKLQKLCLEAQERSKEYHEVQVNFCLNYGGRDEITRACNRLLASGLSNVTEADLAAAMDTAETGDPDFIVRTGGDTRISNFLLWQSAYAEFYFTKTLWPDLSEEELDAAILDFLSRHRRFGGVL